MKRKNRTFALLAVLVSVFAATALMPNMATAAPTVEIYGPSQADITWEQAPVFVDVNNYQGVDFQMYIKYQPAGDTMHYTPQTTYTFSWIQVILTGLPALTNITAWAVVIDGTDTVTSPIPTMFTTKPLPHKAYIGNPVMLTSPTQALITFPYNVSVPTIFFVRYGNYQNTSDTFTVNAAGSGTGVITITNPYTIGDTYSGNLLRGRAISGIVPDSTVLMGPFTVPGYTQPDVANTITFSNVTQDSFKFSASVDLGNALTGVITIRDLDSNGTVVYTRPLIVVGSDTTITPTRTGLPYTQYGERVIFTTNGGSDSVTAFKRTLQVSAPDVISVDTVNATATTTDLSVVVKTNGKPTWPTSDAVVSAKYRDNNNAWVSLPAQQLSGDPAAATVTFTGLNNLKANPNSNTVVVTIQNEAGLVDSFTYSFKLRAPQPAVSIDNGYYVEAVNAFQIRIKYVNAGPSSFPYDVFVLINPLGSGNVDTITTRPNQTGVTNYLQWDTIGNLVGNTVYEIRLGTKNVDGILRVTNKNPTPTAQTVPAAAPSFFISNNINPNSTGVAYRFMGCANGTPSYARVQVIERWDMNVVDQKDIGYLGTGNFDVSDSFNGLIDCNDYQLKVILHEGQLNQQVAQSKDFSTDCTTDVNDIALIKLELFPNPTSSQLNVVAPAAIGHAQVVALDGRVVARYDFGFETQAQISCVDLPGGMYVLKGNNFTQRFVKQ